MAEKQKSFADYVKDLMSVLPTVNNNPMLSVTSQTDVDKYRENPFYMQDAIRKRIAEEEEAKKAVQSKSGLFGAMPSRSSDGGDGAGGGRNYYQEIEDRFYQENLAMGATPEAARTLAERQAFEIQSANNARLAAGLTLGANALIPGVGMLNAAKYGMAYPDFLQGNLRTMMGDSGGYQSPFTPKAAGIAAPVVSGAGGTTRSPSAIQEAIARAQAMSGINGMEAARLAAERAYGSTPIFDLPVDGGMEAARLAAEQAYGVTPTFDYPSNDMFSGMEAARSASGVSLGQDNVGGYGYSNPGVENTSYESRYGGFL